MKNIHISAKFKREDVYIFINSIKSKYDEKDIIEVLDRIYKFSELPPPNQRLGSGFQHLC